METNNYLEQIHENLCAGKNYNSGTRCAVGNYRTTLRCAADEYIVRENPHRIDIEDFVDTLRKAGIKSIVLTDESHLLIEILHRFADCGCTIDELVRIKITDDFGPRYLGGIRLKL